MSAEGEINFFHPVACYLNNLSQYPKADRSASKPGNSSKAWRCSPWSATMVLRALAGGRCGAAWSHKRKGGMKGWERWPGPSCEMVGGLWLEPTSCQVLELDEGHPAMAPAYGERDFLAPFTGRILSLSKDQKHYSSCAGFSPWNHVCVPPVMASSCGTLCPLHKVTTPFPNTLVPDVVILPLLIWTIMCLHQPLLWFSSAVLALQQKD